MTVLSLSFIALFVALWTRWALHSVARQPLLRRRNYRGEEVVGSAGVAFLGSVSIGWLLLGWRGFMEWQGVGAMVVALFVFGIAGLLDDIYGEMFIKGLRGHTEAFLRKRKVTTGFIKAVGGGICGLGLAIWLTDGILPVLVGALLIALSANALNLLDVRPSRALKGFWLLSGIGVGVSHGTGSFALLPLWVATVAYAPDDFRGKAMLGDAGANPLGACLGVWFLQNWSLPAQLSLLAFLIAFHIYAERRSLTADIERIPFLRWFDCLGVSFQDKPSA